MPQPGASRRLSASALPSLGCNLRLAGTDRDQAAARTTRIGPIWKPPLLAPQADSSLGCPSSALSPAPGDPDFVEVAASHAATLLDEADGPYGPEQIREAVARLIEYNPERGFDVLLMDGKMSNQAGDPDLILPDWVLRVDEPARSEALTGSPAG